MILLFTIILALISMIILVFAETYFIQNSGQENEQLSMYQMNLDPDVFRFINDFLSKWKLFFTSPSIIQPDPKSSSEHLSAIDRKISALRKSLQQNLDTLNYLFKMESNFQDADSMNQLNELHEVRAILREKTCELSKELIHYKTLKIKEIVVEYTVVS